jgi:histidinol-phosphate aminotransferase
VANFLLVNLGTSPEEITAQLFRRGVIVRPMAWMGFPHAIRVTIGTHAEIEQFLGAMREVMTPAISN